MREMDTESPVIWPAWCYSAETGGEGDTPSTPLTPVSTVLGQSTLKSRRRRENATSTASTADLTAASIVAATAKMSNGLHSTDYSLHNNNNSVKSERLSPSGSHSATTPDNSSSRSRSVTPSSSSIPGTPPASAAAAAAAASGVASIEHAAMAAASLSGRNYSDFMRSLAAKYNNSNPNEYFLNSTIRNGLIDPRGFLQNMKANSPFSTNNLLTTSSSQFNNNNKDNQHSSENNIHLNSAQQQISPTNNNIKKLDSIFNSPQNPSSIPLYSPMIDMSSTQALLAIVRQVKQDELLLHQQKGVKRSSSSMLSSSSETSSPTTPPTTTLASTPLDLSNAMMLKRTKLVSSRLKNCEGSPGPPELKPPQRPSSVNNNNTNVSSVKSSPHATATVTAASIPLVANCCTSQTSPRLCLGQCVTNSVTEVQSWSVDEVVNFVGSIDLCQEYAEAFREQRIDGAGLPLLTEDHLTNTMNMKLGPALKLKSLLLRKMGSCALCSHCSHCHNNSSEQSTTNSDSASSPSPTASLKRPASNNS